MGRVVRDGVALDRAHAVPLYHQIFLSLRDQIAKGDLGHGDIIPTEHELAEQYGVSRITARRALEELANGGFVARRRRTGTQVIYKSPVKPIEANIDQAVESLLAFGRNTRVKVVEVSTIPADAAIAAKLQIKPGTDVIRAVRLRLAQEGPLGQIVSFIPARLGVDATAATLTRSPMLALLREAGVEIGGAVQTIEAIVADRELADNLSIEARAPVLQVERLVEDGEGRPALLTIAQYRADRYRITLALHEHNEVKPSYADGLDRVAL